MSVGLHTGPMLMLFRCLGSVWEVCVLLELAKHGGKTLNLKAVFIRTAQTHLGDKSCSASSDALKAGV